MNTVFSRFYYEPIAYDPDAGCHETRNGRDLFTVPGTGCVSGASYVLCFVGEELDDRNTKKY